MVFVSMKNLHRGVDNERHMEEPFSNNQLLESIMSADNVRSAWKKVRANKGASGPEGVGLFLWNTVTKS